HSAEAPLPSPRAGGWLEGIAAGPPPEDAEALMSEQLAAADLLGRRTAELHVALSSPRDPAFVPEPMTAMSQRSLYQSMRTAARRTLVMLRQQMRHMQA